MELFLDYGSMLRQWFIDYWRSIVEILMIAYVVYRILYYIQGTRAMQVLKGLIVLLCAFFVAHYLKLDTINLLMAKLFPVVMIALLIVFQSEIRRALSSLGGFSILNPFPTKEAVLDTIADAAIHISKKRYGALIAIENEMNLRFYIESGTMMNANVSVSLIATIFHSNTPLHDGGIVIQDNKIAASGCLFPLTSRPISYGLGTRHLAAIGLSEESDAVVIVVSEETGQISVVSQGKLMQDLDEKKLKKALYMRLIRRKKMRLNWLRKKGSSSS